MTCLAAVVVFLTTYMLILPAITMEHGSMEVTATASEMFLGETNYTEILAKADDGRAETVFALTADGENAGLDGKRIKFSDGGTAKIPTRDGEKVELHREYQEDGQVVYWFALKRGEQANFRFPWVNGVGRYRAEAEVLETFPDGTYVGQEIPEAPDGPDWIPEEWDGSPWISEEESDPTATASELGGTTGRPRSRSGRRQLPIQNGRRDTSWGSGRTRKAAGVRAADQEDVLELSWTGEDTAREIYQYEDEQIAVTAIPESPEALPGPVWLQVTEVNPNTEG